MIYYFSGTGNSLCVARDLADALGESLCPMVLASAGSLSAKGGNGGDAIGLVFPAYAWGIPEVVRKFVSMLPPAVGERYLYAVMTCGDDMGYADRVLDKALLHAGEKRFDAVFSVQMPNTYVCLPGFDVDSKEECGAKYAREKQRAKEIAALVRARKTVRSLRRGVFPRTKTYVIRPLFNRLLLTDKYFRVDASRCVSCGRCSKSCPVGNILMMDERPHWQSHCSGCLACYHACPYHAVNFGRMTQSKGQYNFLKMINETLG